jgi:RHS repeat-associated protein
MENDKETQTQDYGMRIYDFRLGRFLSVDPISDDFPELTPFQFASNTPIQAIDLDGLEKYYTADGKLIGKIGTSTQIRNVNKKDVKAITSYIKWNNFSKSEKYAKFAKSKADNLSHEVKTSPQAKEKPKNLSNSMLEKAGLEISGELNIQGLGGGEILAQGYGRSETDKSGNFEVNGFATQTHGLENAEKFNASISLCFLFDFTSGEDLTGKVFGQVIKVKPYIRCNYGLLIVEQNLSTNEFKIGIGKSLTSKNLTQSISGGCEIGIKEKTPIIQITNDPILETN